MMCKQLAMTTGGVILKQVWTIRYPAVDQAAQRLKSTVISRATTKAVQFALLWNA